MNAMPTFKIAETASQVAEKYLERRIDEIDALVSLLGMARKLDSRQRFGHDLESLDETVMLRVRKLARDCKRTIASIVNDDPDDPPTAEDFGTFED